MKTRGFTIIEVLVATTVLALILVLFGTVLDLTTSAIHSADRNITTSAFFREAGNRMEADLAEMLTAGPAALVVAKNVGGTSAGTLSDAVIFMTQGRTRQRQGIDQKDIRLAIRAYRVMGLPDPELGNQRTPMLARGDGTITWNAVAGAPSQAGTDISDAIKSAVADVVGSSTNGTSLVFQRLAEGIFRLEVNFLLDNGSISCVPPRSKKLAALAAGANVYPVALSAEDSADPDHRFVRALVVAMVGMDDLSRRLTGNNGDKLPDLADAFLDPATGQTILDIWDVERNGTLRSMISAPPYLPAVLHGVRTDQEYYYVN